jgi:hypothetical protein
VALAVVTLAACDQSSAAAERFADSGKRWASLPDSCQASRVTHYEAVDGNAFSDGEFFKLIVSPACSEEWRTSLSQRSDLACSEDMQGIVEANFYDCLNDTVPGAFHARIAFRDASHAEFLWVKVR